jgi:hypothetical protein
MPERLPGDPPPKITTNRNILGFEEACVGHGLIGKGNPVIIPKGG